MPRHNGNGNLSRGERLQIMLSSDELKSVDDFRFKQRMPSRAAAVRELFRIGLATTGLVPALAGQIYVMAGMETRLNLSAHAPGQFKGRNTQYSGSGFSDQNFQVRAVSPADFDAWVASARENPRPCRRRGRWEH